MSLHDTPDMDERIPCKECGDKQTYLIRVTHLNAVYCKSCLKNTNFEAPSL